MPRKRRFYQLGVPAHVFQRGHNKDPVFFEDQDYLAFLRYLKASADALGCLIHAYVLMTNHVYLLVTPKAENGKRCRLLIKNCRFEGFYDSLQREKVWLPNFEV